MVVVDWFGIFFLLRAYELTARILFVLGVWDRFIRSYGQLDFRVCCGKTVLKESDLSDFILTEQFDLKLHLCGTKVSICDPSCHLINLFSHPTLNSALIN